MTEQYPNPPLIEVVCEFRFDAVPVWDQTIPGRLYERLKEQFPKHQSTVAFETTVVAEPGSVQQQVTPVNRSQFLRESGEAMVQVSPNLLAINHLRPYPGWNAYLPIVMQALRTYREIAEPNGIQRIGLRYINRFLFSAGHIELKDFFDFYPHVGPRLPQDYGGFLAGVHMAFDEGRDVIRLQMTDADADRPGELAVVLDLDYYLNKAGGVSLDDVAVWLENAHLRIEQAFEGCVKAPLRERFYEEGNQP